jgi:hypothetical protein
MVELKKVTSDNVYETIHQFVSSGELVVNDYDSMIEVILSMIRGGYCFAMDRDILRDAMESLTYMYAPSDDMNKDRLVQQFADDDDDEDEEEQDDFGNMDLMKMMQMMGGAMGAGATPDRSEDTQVDDKPVDDKPVDDKPDDDKQDFSTDSEKTISEESVAE